MTELEQIDTIVRAYLACVEFTDMGPDCEFEARDFAPTAVFRATADCAEFVVATGDLFDEYISNVDWGYSHEDKLEQFGHDFWLTRNRHGAGFWDRGLGSLGDALSELAHVAGQQSACEVDGLVYLE
jgi:hypothetical protein